MGIAIALLRTSRAEFKTVCAQAFFNIFSHTDIRLQLLKGELWWSLMRLARTDIKTVQHLGAVATFKLCSGGHLYCKLLRDSHIFNFIRDVIYLNDEDLMGMYMLSIEYLLSEIDTTLHQNEVFCVVEASCQCMRRSTSKNIIIGAIRAMMKCATSCAGGSEMEFVKHEIIACLEDCESLWRDEVESVLNSAIVLHYLTAFEGFCKAFRLSDLENLMMIILNGSPHERISSEIEECIVSVIVNHLIHATASINEVMTSKAWQCILERTLHPSKKCEISLEFRDAIISIWAVYFKEISSMDLFSFSDFCTMAMSEEAQPNDRMLRNISHVIAVSSYTEDLSEKIIDANAIGYMYRHFMNHTNINRESSERSYKFCSCVLRNFMSHASCIPKVVDSIEIPDILSSIVQKTKTMDVMMNVCSILYRTLDVDMERKQKGLLQANVCDLCNDILAMSTENKIIHMARYILGATLDKYSIQKGCKPQEVLNMFSEMLDKESSNISNILNKMGASELHDVEPLAVRTAEILSSSCLDAVKNVNYSKPEQSNAVWSFQVSTNPRYEVVTKSFHNSDPLKSSNQQSTEPFPIPSFRKTLKKYDKVYLQNGYTLSEEDEDNSKGDAEAAHEDPTVHEGVVCQTCEERIAVFRCLNCSLDIHLYCGHCLIAHNKNAEHSQHTLREISPDFKIPDSWDDLYEEDNTYDIPSSLAQEFSPPELQLFKHHFSEIDKDKGGTIDCGEFQDLTESLGKRVTPKEAKELINQFDSDGNGCIDFGEFLTLMNAMKKGSAVVENNALIAAIYKHQINLVKRRASLVRKPTEES